MVDNIDSGYVALLKTFRAFTLNSTKELIMPVRMQKGDTEQEFRAADVYLMRLPDSKSATKKAPYILHQLINAKDQQQSGKRANSGVFVRSIFAVYNKDEQEGGLMLLNLAERLRIDLLKKVVIGKRFKLDLETGVEFAAYPEDIAPYYSGEMITRWEIPTVEREVREYL